MPRVLFAEIRFVQPPPTERFESSIRPMRLKLETSKAPREETGCMREFHPRLTVDFGERRSAGSALCRGGAPVEI